jgi:hypothetical protein
VEIILQSVRRYVLALVLVRELVVRAAIHLDTVSAGEWYVQVGQRLGQEAELKFQLVPVIYISAEILYPQILTIDDSPITGE